MGPPTLKESSTTAATPSKLVDVKNKTTHNIQQLLNDRGARFGMSFSGCGFLGTYHFGVVDCLKKHAKSFLPRVNYFGGSSVGSLIAALLIFRPDAFDSALQNFFKLAEELSANRFGALTPGFYLGKRLASVVEDYIPEDISKATDRLFISVTRQAGFLQDNRNIMISDYRSRDRQYLLSCLLASCYIPLYSMGYAHSPPEVDGHRCIDGGFSNNLPILDVPTLTVSPFSGSAIISPTDDNAFEWHTTVGNQIVKVNTQNVLRGVQSLFPPSIATLRDYYEKGFSNTMSWLIDNNMIERDEGSEV